MMIELYDYQKTVVDEALPILSNKGYVYLALEERTGKTLISMSLADDLGYDDILFVTKKKAIPSIVSDYEKGEFSFNLDVINIESLSKMKDNAYDCIVIDEAHSVGAFPKLGKYAKELKLLCKKLKCDIIFLSATPATESHSQWFHQFTMYYKHKWNSYKNFYAWFREYGVPKQKYIRGIAINDYTETKNVYEIIKDDVVTLKREEAGFEHHTAKVRLVKCIPSKKLRDEAEELKRDKTVEISGDYIVADSGASMVSKLHQLSGGTVIGEDRSHRLDAYKLNKAIDISLDKNKVAIYYKYDAEKELITNALGKNWTSDLEEFQQSNKKWFVAQIDSASFGVDLHMCDCHIIYSLTWSGATYIQATNRMMNAKREHPVEVDVLIGLPIDKIVFDAVSKKKNFNARYYERN
jgi:superfamily II DNA or RNA helicase